MITLYWIGIKLYSALVILGTFFNEKAKKFVQGRVGLFDRLKTQTEGFGRTIWIHAASLGEFEQGRPIIEEIKRQSPDKKIVLSFFSPSGYEVRKDYDQVDCVTYLPQDGPANARKFISIVDPEVAIFIKYEFWYFYLKELKNQKVPVLLVSSIFRESQLFFNWSGSFFSSVLASVNHYFVQDEPSKKLIGRLTNRVTVSGDTRFDRVLQIAAEAQQIPAVEDFVGDSQCMVVGSSWDSDLIFLKGFIETYQHQMKFIIAPHNLKEDDIQQIEAMFGATVRFSTYQRSDAHILIIDNMGMLSSVYRYADFAWVGGAFRGALHNTLEAAVYGMPIFIGAHANNEKFREATGLQRAGALQEFYDEKELAAAYLSLKEDTERYNNAAEAAKQFVVENSGATKIVTDYIFKKL